MGLRDSLLSTAVLLYRKMVAGGLKHVVFSPWEVRGAGAGWQWQQTPRQQQSRLWFWGGLSAIPGVRLGLPAAACVALTSTAAVAVVVAGCRGCGMCFSLPCKCQKQWRRRRRWLNFSSSTWHDTWRRVWVCLCVLVSVCGYLRLTYLDKLTFVSWAVLCYVL